MQLNYIYSDTFDEERIKNTLQKYQWFKEQRYRINLPEKIKAAMERGEVVGDEDVARAVEENALLAQYQEAVEHIQHELAPMLEKFSSNLETLGGEVQPSYDVYLTKYGVGGSYFWPNKVVLNIDYGRINSWKTVIHEIVHLSIEDKIQAYKIPHWVKERLVDLIIRKFYGESEQLQRNPEHHEEVEEIFLKYFPNMHKVIEEVALIIKK